MLFDRNLESGYGSSVVKRLSVDLKEQFPDMGLSPRNLWDMKRFYERYKTCDSKLRQAVAVLPWGHNLLLINKIDDNNAVEFYACNFSQLCDQFMIVRNYAKDTEGLFTRIIGKISAMIILQYINNLNGRPIGRTKYALI